MKNTAERAKGNWQKILVHLGVPVEFLNGRHHPCPACGGKDRFRFDDKQGAGTYICGQCGAGDGFSLVQKIKGYLDFKSTATAIDGVLGIETPPSKLPKSEKQRNDNNKGREQREAASKALNSWKRATASDGYHPYLVAKGVPACGIRELNGKLIIPVVDIHHKLTSLQTISRDGKKLFFKNGKVHECFYRIKQRDDSDKNMIVFCEGFATGASIHKATGLCVVVTFTANNMPKVVKLVGSLLTKTDIVIAADNDKKTAVNTGLNAAIQAAQGVNGRIALPEGIEGKNVDWSDIMCEKGLYVVEQGIYNAVQPDELLVELAKVDSEALTALTSTSVEGGGGRNDEWATPKLLPASLLPVHHFDPDILPSIFRDYALDVATRMQCPLEFIAVSLMTTLSGVVGKRCSIYPKAEDDWLVVPNLWGALVGRPSTMKSPAIKAATLGVDAIVKKAKLEYAHECESFDVQRMVFEAKQKVFKEDIAKSIKSNSTLPNIPPKKPKPPVEKRYITSAGTVENLIKLLSEQKNGIIQLRDELVGWINAMENSSGQDARSFYLEAWNGSGSSFSYDTMTHGSLYLESGPCIAVLGGIQPSLIANIVHQVETGKSGDDGMLQRFQLLVYPDKIKGWKYCDQEPNKMFAEMVQCVFSQAVEISGKLNFSDSAQAIFIEWYTDLMHRVQKEEHLGMESHLSKYPQLMPALALLIHLVDYVSEAEEAPLTNVSQSAAEKAVKWCELLESHARRVYAMGHNNEVTAAKKIIDSVVSGKLSNPFQMGELYKLNITNAKTSNQASKVLELLVNYGWARLEEKATGGRPSVFCTIHPRADSF